MTIEDIALIMTSGIGVKGAMHLIDTFGSAEKIFLASLEELTQKSQIREDLAIRIVQREAYKNAEREIKYCAKHDIKVIASTDEEYPKLLREVNDYPHVIYVKGSVEALNANCVSMVGTRKATQYGVRMCDEFVNKLADRVPNICIVSGLAFGIDIACHRAALYAGVKTVAVLANSLPAVMPTQHENVAREIIENGGALVSEYNSQTKQNGSFYLARNRIIAAMSAGTIVVESPFSGGSLMTAHCAAGYGRSVMAIPGRVTDKMSSGTNALIRNQTAQAVLSAEDVVKELMWDVNLTNIKDKTKPKQMQLTSSEEQMLEIFKDKKLLSIEEIENLCNLNTSELSVILLGLELAGAIQQLPGNRYECFI